MKSTAILLTAIIGMTVTGLLGFLLIPWLKRLKFGQNINNIGPVWHQSKQGTPTMGGLMFICGTLAALITGYVALSLEKPAFLSQPFVVRLFAGVGVALCFGLVGFLDDYIKIKKKRNLGLRARYKIFFQIGISAVYLYVMAAFGGADTMVTLPFLGSHDFGIWYYVISMIFIIGMVNSVNLTDGLDGLASTVTFFVSAGMIVISTILGYAGASLFSTAVAASCIGFVLWNFYPAKVFMGDTGSMFLGGAVVAMAYGMSLPALLIPAGIAYLMESGSVMMQVGYFKLTKGKRIFKMSPIHHHFEMCGLSEVKIVVLFSAITIVGVAVAILAAALI